MGEQMGKWGVQQEGEERGPMLVPRGRWERAEKVAKEAASEAGRAGPVPEMGQVECSADRARG